VEIIRELGERLSDSEDERAQQMALVIQYHPEAQDLFDQFRARRELLKADPAMRARVLECRARCAAHRRR